MQLLCFAMRTFSLLTKGFKKVEEICPYPLLQHLIKAIAGQYMCTTPYQKQLINNYIYLHIFLSICLLCACSFPAVRQNRANTKSNADTMIIKQADPTILYHKGTYYLYGTGGYVNRGFRVYQSTDLQRWEGPVGAANGYALVKGEAYGTKGFWAPHVIFFNSKFYMFYTADENIAVAESSIAFRPVYTERT